MSLAVQSAHTAQVAAEQHEQIHHLNSQLSSTHDTATLSISSGTTDGGYQETRVLRDMQRRVAAHTDEAAAAHRAMEASRAACAAAEAEAAAANESAARERATLTTELTELRSKCQLRINQATEAQEKLSQVETALQFAEQQKQASEAAAHAAAVAAADRVAALEGDLEGVRSEAAALAQRLEEQGIDANALRAELAGTQAQVRSALRFAVWTLCCCSAETRRAVRASSKNVC